MGKKIFLDRKVLKTHYKRKAWKRFTAIKREYQEKENRMGAGKENALNSGHLTFLEKKHILKMDSESFTQKRFLLSMLLVFKVCPQFQFNPPNAAATWPWVNYEIAIDQRQIMPNPCRLI